MILDGKKFEFGLCPSCDKRRPVYVEDGLCYGCGGHAMQLRKRPKTKSPYFLTVDWCNQGKRGVFCNIKGVGFRKETKHTDMEMLDIMGGFYAILDPKSESFTVEELEKLKRWKPLAEYQNQFVIAR